MKLLAIPLAAAAVAFALVGCSAPSPAVMPETAPAPAVAEQTATPEENAQRAAASMDPVFADPATWQAALEAAKSDCALADVSPETAWNDSLILAIENDVTAEQAGIIWGIAVALYCPEHEGIIG
jgi:PBP1b-binding outer membrane lipoprotein LpoB